MLMSRARRSPAACSAIAAVSEAGLVVTINGDEREISWKAVDTVVAGMSAHRGARIFVLALEIDDAEGSRLFGVAEIEKIWPTLTAILPVALPKIEPFERWGASLAAKPGAVTLYERRRTTLPNHGNSGSY